MKKFAALDMGMMWRGMFFIKTGGILFLKLRGKRGMFFYWAGFRRDIGWVSQLMETQLTIILLSIGITENERSIY